MSKKEQWTAQEQQKVADLAADMLQSLKTEEERENPVRKRFWLFAGGGIHTNLPPRGGMKDFKGQFDTLEAAHEKAEEVLESMGPALTSTWAHIVDTCTGEIGEVKRK